MDIRSQKRVRMAFLVLILGCAVLTGCTDETESTMNQTGDAAESKEEKTVIIEDEDIPDAPKSLKEVIAQQPGKLVEEHMEPDVEAARTVNFTTYNKFYDHTFKEIAQDELSVYFTGNKLSNSDEIYNYLVYQLGSGQYESLYRRLESYEHGYVMPELPEGKDKIEIAKVQKTNIVILMDASGSMKAEVKGGSKMKLAKEAIETFTAGLDTGVNVSLLAYGHKGAGTEADKKLSCQTIDTVYPLGSYDEPSFHEAMDSFQASGWTPLAGAIEKADAILASQGSEAYRNIVYIVSDGIETCGGDPIKAAKKLNDSKIEAKVNIIGFDVDDEGQAQLKQVAEAGGGSYATVRDQNDFEGVLLKKWQPSLMQVISQQGVKLQDLVGHLTELVEISEPLVNISDREANRVIDAASFLRSEKLISEENGQKVIDQAQEIRELRNDHFREIKERKSEEAEQIRNEINAKVEAWKEKWHLELDK
ncbi:MAG TPA: VWA domain-containing protein [Sporosarcina psychrophila]|uniref:VWA domain-containing protein n=1 Tax=Sporosarcina psychrophila TaxID=1476 RepID=A0A921KDV6_SPOPS|nr:VWA domain-containing protein [Sporosarcina psychrophila]